MVASARGAWRAAALVTSMSESAVPLPDHTDQALDESSSRMYCSGGIAAVGRRPLVARR